MKDLEHATILALAGCNRPHEQFDDAEESWAEAGVGVVDQLAVVERLHSMITALPYEEI